ncbi:hypothetical protein ACFL1T_01825 [Chlamydiota bacterium]
MRIRVKLILNVIAVCLACLFTFYFVFIPQYRRTQKKRHEIKEKTLRKEQLQKAAHDYKNIEELITQEKRLLDELDHTLPQIKSIPDVIHMIDGEIKQLNIDVLSLKQNELETVKAENLIVYKLDLSVSLYTDFFTLLQLLRNIYLNKNIINIRNMSIIRNTSVYPLLQIDLNISAFFSKEKT